MGDRAASGDRSSGDRSSGDRTGAEQARLDAVPRVGQTDRRSRALVAVAVALASVAAACTGGSESGQLGPEVTTAQDVADGRSAEDSADRPTPTVRATTTEPPTTTTLPPIDLDLVAGFEQLTLRAAEPGDVAVVVDEGPASEDRVELGRGEVADNGTALLRELTSGEARVEIWRDGEPIGRSDPVTIPDSTPPPDRFYDQDLEPGFGYLTTRDGTTLSAFVTLPGPVDQGPYPTLVEYSGYSPSDPDADDPTRLLVPTLGYALVQVNVRGTGCSGGSFDAFEPIQALDGYDTIEVVAAQQWSSRVGMFGISYPGIMQLHVAAATPPSLAAIAPLSVIDEVGSVLYPGGIYNNGFGEDWTRRVSNRAEPFGQGWTGERADAGDTVCRANQELRVHNPDLVALVKASPHRSELTESRSPAVETIEVPVFLAGAWQDEQTGGRFPSLIEEFERAPEVRATMYNGLHVDPLGPDVLARLAEFYGLYVAEETGGLDFITRLAAGAALSTVFGEPVSVPPTRFDGLDLDVARDKYEAEPGVRVLFEQGARRPNLPVPHFEASFASWPPEEIEPTRLYLSEAGRLREEPALGPGQRTFEADADAGSIVTTDNLASIWTNQPEWAWPEGSSAARFTSDAFDSETAFVGPASADLFVELRSPEAGHTLDADLEVTLSEIASDGSETYIQSGWLRVSRRALGEGATDLRPVPSLREEDVALVEPGEVVEARVEILPFAHVIRPGSKLRITIDSPGGSRPQWTFEPLSEAVTVAVLTGADHPSSVLLPVIRGLEIPHAAPPCGSLRGQPCRR